MDQSPLISIIIPTYNRAGMLPCAVKSILAQEYDPVEIIIVDDCSTDNTMEVVSTLTDPRIRYILCDSNGGAGAARNIGMKQAKGEWIAFLDSDDEYLLTRLSKQVDVFQSLSPTPGLVFTNYMEIGENKTLHVHAGVPSGFIDASKKFPASVHCTPPSSWMIAKEIVETVGFFDEELRTMEDLDYFLRIVEKYPAYFLNELLLVKHVHTCKKGSVPIEHAQKTGERILEKWYPRMRKDKNYLVKFYCMMGKDLWSAGKKEKASSFLRKAFFVQPYNPSIWAKMIKYR